MIPCCTWASMAAVCCRMAINDLNAEHMLLGDFMKSEHGQALIKYMEEQGEVAGQASRINFILKGIQLAAGLL